MLSEVLYVSRSLHRKGHASDLEILQEAQSNNERNDLTGCLIRGTTWFVQSLEGPSPALRQVFQAIQKDARHSDIEFWISDSLAERRFPEWRMLLADVAFEQDATERMYRDPTVTVEAKHEATQQIFEAHLKTLKLRPNGRLQH